jgi:hypothetical protein
VENLAKHLDELPQLRDTQQALLALVDRGEALLGDAEELGSSRYRRSLARRALCFLEESKFFQEEPNPSGYRRHIRGRIGFFPLQPACKRKNRILPATNAV